MTREEHGDLERLDDLVERPGEHPLVNATADAYRRDDIDESWFGEHHPGRGLGHVDGVHDGEADLGLLEAGASFTPSPVMPTTWPNACSDRTISTCLRGSTRAKTSDSPARSGRRAVHRPGHRRVDADLGADRGRGGGRVAGDHLDVDAEFAKLAHQLGRVVAGR
jgi:hypothetical protein